ncbi:hypothetical protein GQ53DRAFT_329562 [Thozetella sp. PMI_491]|nr:hypothetical protein GQ53DRAFT_329562 [Thozetella sp. PMI_491]
MTPCRVSCHMRPRIAAMLPHTHQQHPSMRALHALVVGARVLCTSASLHFCLWPSVGAAGCLGMFGGGGRGLAATNRAWPTGGCSNSLVCT